MSVIRRVVRRLKRLLGVRGRATPPAKVSTVVCVVDNATPRIEAIVDRLDNVRMAGEGPAASPGLVPCTLCGKPIHPSAVTVHFPNGTTTVPCPASWP